jgi:hypothetical protein
MIHQHQWPAEACEFHNQIARAVLAREAREPGLAVSNVGGWHSSPDLPIWEDEGIADLIDRIGTVTEGVGAGGMRMQAWANVMRAGGYHLAHRHGEAVWSGVYYVEAGDADSGGAITFARGREVERVVPRAGLLLLFPGELLHSVATYTGTAPRISVAFNLWSSESSSE